MSTASSRPQIGQQTEVEWTGPRPFVGREAVLKAVDREVDAVMAEGRGRAVFLLGPGGSGKTATAGLIQELAFREYRELRAQYVDCAQSGTRTWAELAELFTRRYRLKRSARRLVWEWVEVVPIVGKFIKVLATTVRAIRTGHAEEEGEPSVPAPTGDSAVRAVRLLLEHGPQEARLIVFDSLDRGDSEDLAGAFALMRRLPELRTIFLATVRTADDRPPEAIGDLILEAERLDAGRRIELPKLEAEELRETVERAIRGTVPEAWLDWLVRETAGLPGALWSTLSRLEASGSLRRAGRGWSFEGDPPRQAASSMALAHLGPGDRNLLTLAAVEGPVFHSAVLAELADRDELALEDDLARLCRARVLEYRDLAGPAADVTSRYAFRDPDDADALVAELTESDRDELVARAAEARSRLGLEAPARGRADPHLPDPTRDG